MVVPAADNMSTLRRWTRFKKRLSNWRTVLPGFCLLLRKLQKIWKIHLRKYQKILSMRFKISKSTLGRISLSICFCSWPRRCLSSIDHRLQAINDQSLILTTLLPIANKKAIDDCVAAFQDSITQFQVSLPLFHGLLVRILNSEYLVSRHCVIFTLPRIYLDSRRSWLISMELQSQCRRR